VGTEGTNTGVTETAYRSEEGNGHASAVSRTDCARKPCRDQSTTRHGASKAFSNYRLDWGGKSGKETLRWAWKHEPD